MATFRKRNNRWDVQIRRSGYQPVSKSFSHKIDAQRWAAETERQIEVGEYFPAEMAPLDTLRSLLERYGSEISNIKRGRVEELSRLSKMQRHNIADVPLGKLRAFHISKYRDDRLQQVSGTTVKKELQLISHALEIARKEWGMSLKNVVSDVAKPREPRGRDRRLEGNEEYLLMDALAASENFWVKPLVELAIETAMRRGELLSLQWRDADLERQTVFVAITKNGDSRQVPLSLKAISVISNLPRDVGGKVFPVSPNALRGVWRRTIKKLNLENLRFHDLRHEATSRFFENGLNVMEVAAITGHKDLRMLQRYTHLRAEDLAKKLG